MFKFIRGGRSSVGRALDCGSRRRGFKSRRSPIFPIYTILTLEFFPRVKIAFSIEVFFARLKSWRRNAHYIQKLKDF